MIHAVIVGAAPLAGQDEFYRALIGGAGVLVAADAAGEWCVELGRVPDVVVGDFDSSAPGAAERLRELGAEVVLLARDKDVSDLDAAVDMALSRGVSSITLTGAYTARVDHTLCALGSLARAGAHVPAYVREPGWRAIAVTPDRPLQDDLDAGTTFSVVAIGAAQGVGISGARFPLASADMGPLSSLGLSNESLGGRLRVDVGRGLVIVIVVADGPSR
jgi:thiamine pyrophosphokinase